MLSCEAYKNIIICVDVAIKSACCADNSVFPIKLKSEYFFDDTAVATK